MKYIRTKDGRINYLDTEPYEDEPNYVVITNKGKINFYRPDQVVKQASTVKELCDELIIKNPNNDGEFYKKVFVYENMWEKILNEKHAQTCTNRDIYKDNVEIFGAVWTYDSNGAPTLKSVAKMNDKGELELL